jgi:hypothetical protein
LFANVGAQVFRDGGAEGAGAAGGIRFFFSASSALSAPSPLDGTRGLRGGCSFFSPAVIWCSFQSGAALPRAANATSIQRCNLPKQAVGGNSNSMC